MTTNNHPQHTALRLDQVEFAYGTNAPMHFNFALPQGARLAVMGPSGSGKSTLLHLIAGFEVPLSGTIAVGGIEVNKALPALRPVSMLFQDNNLFGHLTVAQNVGLGIAPRLTMSNGEQAKIDDALTAVGLDGFGERLPASMSGGERQRAALARILIRDKPLLLLDEPFAALGPAMRREMIDLLLTLPMQTRPTMLMVTHAPDDARAFATDLLAIIDGKNQPIEPISTLDHPQSGSALAAYLGSRDEKS
jgi:thiamine transport system ATP-binding protein